jgi:hypothetical protein
LLKQEEALIKDNLTEKKMNIIQNIVTNPREGAQLTEILKQKVPAKAQRIRSHEIKETHYLQNKMFQEDTKKGQNGQEDKRMDRKIREKENQ